MSKFFTTETAEYHDLHFITVKSRAMNRRADITVYNPCLEKEHLKSVPLVILLHGVYGSHWAWALKGKVHETLNQMIASGEVSPMILAMPSDGLFGDGSGYLPHISENYERWITEDVIEVMNEQYPEIDEKSPVFIAGLSMGGYGAIRLGAKNPHLFHGISGLSSITKFEQHGDFLQDFDHLINVVTEKQDLLELLVQNRSALPPFRFDCGIDDPLIAPNRELHLALINRNIQHQYEEFEGAHSWDYWQKNIGSTLRFFDQLVTTSQTIG